jgi:putative endonuclease
MWWLYVVRCADGTYYTGIALDVVRRVREHNESHRGSKYTRGRRPVKLVAAWAKLTHGVALRDEIAFKKLGKVAKERLIVEGARVAAALIDIGSA